MIKSKNRTCGLTIIELLLAMALGLVVLLQLMYFYQSMKQLYRDNIGILKINESGTTALELITHDLEQAGFFGCNRPEYMRTMDHTQSEVPVFDSSFYAHAWSNLGEIPRWIREGIKRELVTDSDIIFMEYMGADVAYLRWVADNRQEIIVSGAHEFKVDERIIIASCRRAEIFKVQDARRQGHETRLYLNSKLKGNYPHLTQVARLVAVIYFVAKTGRFSETGEQIYALYRRDLLSARSSAVEMVANIDKLKFNFGICRSCGYGASSKELAHSNVWSQVRYVNISLLADSEVAFLKSPKMTYFFPQLNWGPDARRVGILHATSQLRSRS